MPFWVFSYTNPFVLIVYFSLFEVIFRIISAILHKTCGISFNLSFKYRLLIYAVLIVISIVVHFRILFTNDYRKSMVDVSPIANLTNEQIDRLEDVLNEFEDYDFIRRFEAREHEYHMGGIRMTYEIRWFNGETRSSLYIWVKIYKSEHQAIESFQFRLTSAQRHRDRYTLITNGNNTEAILFDSWMDRAGHGVPVPRRHLRSEIRLGNAVITLSDDLYQHQLHMNTSSDFIEFLCEKLTQ